MIVTTVAFVLALPQILAIGLYHGLQAFKRRCERRLRRNF